MGGKTSSTWPKGKKPPVSKPKGTLNNKTKVARALGLENWSQLEQWAENDGIKACVEKMKRMKGQAYVNAFTKLLEYVKPKLSRIEATGKDGDPLFEKPDLSRLSKDELLTFIELSKKVSGGGGAEQ